MIDIDVKKSYDRFNIEASLKLESNGITALFGRSGAGKTSIANIIAGLLHPDQGRVMLGDTVLCDTDRGISLPPEKRRIGYVFQQARLFPHLSVARNLTYGWRRRASADHNINPDDVIDLLGLQRQLAQQPGSLSGGERQRVAFGRAVLSNPDLLIMDEPLSSLDAARKYEILPFIERLRDQFAIPILYVSHSMDEIIRLADDLVLMDDGKVAAQGKVEDLTSRLDLRPLTGRYEAGSVISVTVAGHDTEYCLTKLEFSGGRFFVPQIDAMPGTTVRLQIRARDVSIMKSRPQDTSELNIFSGTIAEIAAPASSAESHCDICVDIGVPLWARLTRYSLNKMRLEPGSQVFASVKSTSVDRESLGGQKESLPAKS